MTCRTNSSCTETSEQAVTVGVFARVACASLLLEVSEREKILSIGGYDHSVWKCHMFLSAWEFSNPTRERMAGWTLWQGSSFLHYGMRYPTSGRNQDSGICLAQLLDTSLVWLESQCSFCPRLMDMAVVFLFANSTNSKAEHVF